MSARGTNVEDLGPRVRDGALETDTWKPLIDGPDAQVLLDLIDFLSGSPDPQSLCRHLTLNEAEKPRPIGALIVILEPNGVLRIAGAFGLDIECVAAREGQTLTEESPLADVIRSGEPRFHDRASSIQTLFPEFETHHGAPIPTAIWPISSNGDRIGAIQLFFEEDASQSPLTANLAAVVALIALYIGLQLVAGVGRTRWSASERRKPPGGTGLVTDQRRPFGMLELTERQATILEHISAGRTNAQIAHIVGFSESTVRQETMAIYRTLGVDGRGQAAAMARASHAQASLAAVPSA